MALDVMSDKKILAAEDKVRRIWAKLESKLRNKMDKHERKMNDAQDAQTKDRHRSKRGAILEKMNYCREKAR